MKTYTAAAFVALASVATAQLSNIPSCALTCFLDALGKDGCSSLTDFACHCKKSDSLFSAVTPCVQKACSAADQATVITAVEGTCKDAGVPITVSVAPTSAAAASSSAAPVSSAAPASSAAAVTSAAAVSSYAASVASSVASEASSLASVVSSAVASVTSAAGNATASATPSVSQFTGGAPRATQAAGILAAAGLAILAL